MKDEARVIRPQLRDKRIMPFSGIVDVCFKGNFVGKLRSLNLKWDGTQQGPDVSGLTHKGRAKWKML